MTAALRAAPTARAARAEPADAEALFALSAPFMRSGELRERPPAAYRRPEELFLVVRAPAHDAYDAPGAPLDACVALRVLAPERGHPATGLLHNLCVRADRQGRGLGSVLVSAVSAAARRAGLRALVTATTGDGALFLRHGYREIPAAAAPPAFAAGLDPARGSRVFARPL
ncbi:GNAT family N-acetyltransferase [Kitasatospora sp. NPDC089797]|uniref:GNAT family N-acetyltransferase n=1 Tax=Kitasatospora sp. NPDC089797 TaxID=3155298 RepID=UPI00342DE7BC